MNIRFDKMTAIVTGGANGIGLATAKLLRDSGASVCVLDREVCGETGIETLQGDLTDPTVVAELFARRDQPDVVVINAGACYPASIEQTTPETWRKTMSINLDAAFYTLQATAKAMRARQGGSIVFTASTNSFDGEASLIAYNASKAALLGLVHTAANELGPHGIRVNAVCPGLIRTRLTDSSFADETVIQPYFRHLPMGRGGRPDEVAQAIVFLASSQASYITGATLMVDGGQMCTKFATWPQENAKFEEGKWTLIGVSA